MSQRTHLRLSARSVVVVVVIVLVGLAAVRVIGETTRVLGWVAVAAIVAGLLHPVVAGLSRRMPRPLAMLAVVVGLLVPIAALVYGSVDQLQDEAERLEETAPDAAREIERSARFGEAAREFRLADRVEDLVEEIPNRLRGGDAATALRSAATRGVAFLATGVLTLFLILHGPTLVRAGLGQVRDPRRRSQLRRTLEGGYRKAWVYTWLTLGRAVLAGVFAFVVCEVAEVPGSLVLAVWVGVFSLVPLLGVVTGGLAVVLLSVAIDPDLTLGLTALFVAYQVFEVLVLQRRLEGASVHVGPVASLVAAMVGLEAYGIGGLLVGLVLVIFVTSMAATVVREDVLSLHHHGVPDGGTAPAASG